VENPIYFLVFKYIKFSIRTFDRIRTAVGFDRAERTTAKNMLADEVKWSAWQNGGNKLIYIFNSIQFRKYLYYAIELRLAHSGISYEWFYHKFLAPLYCALCCSLINFDCRWKKIYKIHCFKALSTRDKPAQIIPLGCNESHFR